MHSLHVVHVNAQPERGDEFNDWYENVHIPDVLSIPGVLKARRYALEDDQLGHRNREYPYRYLTLYELDGDHREIVRAINEAIVSGRFSLSTALNPVYVAPVFRLLSEHTS